MYKKWIDLGGKKGITDLEVFAVRNKSLKLSVYQNKLDQHVVSDVEVVTIRGIYKDKLSTVKFENLANTNVDYMLDKLIENAKALTVVEPAIIYEGSSKYPKVNEETFDFGSVEVAKKIELLKSLEQKILENEWVTQVQATMYQETDTETNLINSKGLNLKRHMTYAYAYAVGVFQKDDDIKTSHDIKLAKKFSAFDADSMAKETIKKGVAKLGGKSMKSGSYPVVFSNDMFGDILGVFTSVFSGESAYRSLTPLKGRVDEKIGGVNISLIDDPLNEKAYFMVPFDDEGVACSKKHIVDKGVFKGFVHNLKTASIFKKEPTGNSFGGAISMTNFYLEPKEQGFNQLIENIKDGVYITDLVGLHAGVKVTSGDFNLQASGFRIKDGKLGHPVKMIVVSGNFFDVLNEIQGIGSDLKFGLSNTGSPSVHVKSLMIGGEE